MSEFEFLSVLVSIVIGLGLTHILKGSVSLAYKHRLLEPRLIYAIFLVFIFVLDWWTIFSWSDQESWNFSDFLILITWAISHYIAAIILYPLRETGDSDSFPLRYFLLAFASVAFLDILQTYVRGDLFDPWYYLPFVLHYAFLSIIGFYVDTNRFHRFLGWWFLIVSVVWALIVRKYLL